MTIENLDEKKLVASLVYSCYAFNRDEGLSHEQLLSVGIGNDLMKAKYEKEKAAL